MKKLGASSDAVATTFRVISTIGAMVLRLVRGIVGETGNIALFFSESVRLIFASPSRFPEIIRHIGDLSATNRSELFA